MSNKVPPDILEPDERARINEAEEKKFDDSWKTGKALRPRTSLQKRLDELGISEDEAEKALGIFGPRGTQLNVLRYDRFDGKVGLGIHDPAGWRFWTNPDTGRWIPLSSLYLLLDHFLHLHRTIATEMYRRVRRGEQVENEKGERVRVFAYTWLLAIDLDRDGADPDDHCFERFHRILDQSEVEPVVFRSSNSGGLHLFWHLPGNAEVDDLHDYAEGFLEHVGILVRKGVAEVFPDIKNKLRVPFGPGSALLDPQTLRPIEGTFAAKLRHVFRRFDEHRAGGKPPFGLEDDWTSLELEPIDSAISEDELVGDPGAWAEEDESDGPDDTQRHRTSGKEVGRRLYEVGLTGRIVRYEAIPIVVRYCYDVLGFTGKALEAEVVKWLEEKHNNQSSRYLRDPASANRDIHKVVEDYLAYCRLSDRVPGHAGRSMTLLSLYDYQEIRRLAEVLHPEFGKRVKFDRVFFGLSDLFQYCLRKCDYEERCPVIDLPRKAMERFIGWTMKKKSPSYYKDWLKRLEAHDVLIPHDPRYWEGRSKKYRLVYAFHEGPPIPSHDDGLALTAPEE